MSKLLKLLKREQDVLSSIDYYEEEGLHHTYGDYQREELRRYNKEFMSLHIKILKHLCKEMKQRRSRPIHLNK